MHVGATTRRAPERPNIIYIVCHDLGKELGCYGRPIATPNIDAFASEGVKFTNYFCNSPACSPSRCCAYTGMYAHTNGVMGLAHEGWSLPPGVRTVVDEFNDGGYETVHIGFQHERPLGTNRYQVDLQKGTHQESFVENVTEQTLDVLKERGNKGKPLYLNVGIVEAHASLWLDQWKKNRKDTYGSTPPGDTYMPPYIPDTPALRKEMGNFQACMRFLDRHVVDLFRGVEAAGFREDTLVAFTTDHGISNCRAKGTLYDAGVEITLLMKMPGFIEPGKNEGVLLQNIDMAPTLLDLAGLPIPARMQGKSFLPLLAGEAYDPHEYIFMERTYHDDYDPMRAIRTPQYHYIRSFDAEAKKEWLPDEPPYMNETYELWHNALWPLKSIPRDPEELFDTEKDPYEFGNVAYAPEYAETRRELAEKLNDWMKRTDDPILNGAIPVRGDNAW